MRHLAVCVGVLMMLAGVGCQQQQNTGARWYKGNLHTHTLWSDGDDFPEPVAAWYRGQGYQFLALTDHNVLSAGEKWVTAGEIRKRLASEAMERYLGSKWKAETKGEKGKSDFAVRLRTYEEVKGKLERAGRFVMIQGEEISDKAGKLPIHVGAINVAELIRPQGGETVTEVMANNLRAVREQGERLNRVVLPHVNHPNFGWAITAEELAAVEEEEFFEVYNGHPIVNHLGDKKHMGVERMWDVANTIRVGQLGLRPLLGLGCDDSHNYHRTGMSRAAPGRGWIMVRAKELTAEAIIGAMRAGDFYASSGVKLRDVIYSQGTLQVEVRPEGGEVYTTEFVGTMRGSEKVGEVLGKVVGNRAKYVMTGRELYVRAVVTSSKQAEVPVYAGQLKQAWTQAVGGK